MSKTIADAVAYAASIEQITRLGEWKTAADSVLTQAAEAEQQARAQAGLEARRAGTEPAAVERMMNTAGIKARKAVFAKYTNEPWQTDIDTLKTSDAELHMLEILARLPLSAPLVLAPLLNETVKERTLRARMRNLEAQGLVAVAAISVTGRRGRPAPCTR